MTDLVQRYTRAVASTNLKVDQYHMDADVLMAIAMSGGLAALLARVKYMRDASAYNPLLRSWREVVARKAIVRKWEVSPVAIAKISLDYWVGDQCAPCNGTGFPLLKNIPTRGAKACAICEGSGRKPLICKRHYRELSLDMYQELCAIFDRASQRAKRKLR